MACMHLQDEEVHWGCGTWARAGTRVLVDVPGGPRGARHRAGGPLGLPRWQKWAGWGVVRGLEVVLRGIYLRDLAIWVVGEAMLELGPKLRVYLVGGAMWLVELVVLAPPGVSARDSSWEDGWRRNKPPGIKPTRDPRHPKPMVRNWQNRRDHRHPVPGLGTREWLFGVALGKCPLTHQGILHHRHSCHLPGP